MKLSYWIITVFAFFCLFMSCKPKLEDTVVRRVYFFERYFEGSTSPDDYLIMSVTDSLKERFVESYFIDSRSGKGDIITQKYKLVSGDTLLYSEGGMVGFVTRFQIKKCDTLKSRNEILVNCYKGKETITYQNQKNIAAYHLKSTRESDFGILEWDEYYDKNMILVKRDLVKGTHSKPYHIQRTNDIPAYVKIGL